MNYKQKERIEMSDAGADGYIDWPLARLFEINYSLYQK